MASRYPHSGGSRPGTSWSTGAKGSSESERRNSSQHRRYSHDAPSKYRHRSRSKRRFDETPRPHRTPATPHHWDGYKRTPLYPEDHPDRKDQRDVLRGREPEWRGAGGGGISKDYKQGKYAADERKEMLEKLMANTPREKLEQIESKAEEARREEEERKAEEARKEEEATREEERKAEEVRKAEEGRQMEEQARKKALEVIPLPPPTPAVAAAIPATPAWNPWWDRAPAKEPPSSRPPSRPPSRSHQTAPAWTCIQGVATPSPPSRPPSALRDPRLLREQPQQQQQLELHRPPFCSKQVATPMTQLLQPVTAGVSPPAAASGDARDPTALDENGLGKTSPMLTPRPSSREGCTPGREKPASSRTPPYIRLPLASREAKTYVKGAVRPDGSNKENHRHRARPYSPPVKHAKPPVGGQPAPHPPDFTDGGTYLRLYKVVYDKEVHTEEPKMKECVRRFNGKCGERHKKYDYPDKPKDPRSWYRRVDQAKDLPLPPLIVDDQYVGIPPKREVTISNLNDNVSRDFLLKMARNQKLEPEEVIVFYHPATKKHLQMALIIFHKSADARAFVGANHGQKVMGIPIGCIFDPFAAELSAAYGLATGGVALPPLPHLSGMSDHELSLRREAIIGKRVGAPKTPPLEAPPLAPPPVAAAVPSHLEREKDNRSLSPMDTSNSPAFEALIPPPPFEHPPLLPPHVYHDDAGASTSKMASPPPPYSELPPINHGVYEEIRPESRKRADPEPEAAKARSSKRRRPSTSSSSSESSPGEGHGSRHRSEGGVKKKREEYLKVKRYISSERDSNGDKHIVKEVKTVTYKRRTEHTLGKKDPSPDSFDEEMKRREREMNRSATRGAGKDEMRWSTPSSDSDAGREGAGRRKRGKERSTTESQDERRPPGADAPCASASTLSAPSLSLSSSSTLPPSTPSSSISSCSRRSGFASAPVFDPTQPPPVIVPPVGLLVLPPDCSQPPPPMPPPHMMVPPPPLPGGFIPPPEFFGLQPTPALMCAASAAGLSLGLPPPPMPPSMCGYGGATPRPTFASPVKMPHASQSVDAAAAASRSLPSVFSSPPLTTSSSGGRTPMAMTTTVAAAAAGRMPAELRVNTPTYSEGGSTPRPTAAATAAAATVPPEKKGNLDDRLSQLFGLKKAKKEEAAEIKHAAAAAPSMSSTATAEQQRKRDDDDMEIDDDDDMDVASSSSDGGTKPIDAENKRGGEPREKGESEEEKRHREREEIRKKEEMVEALTKITLDKLMRDLEQQITKDLQRKLELTAYQTLEMWQKRQSIDEEEKKKQMIRDLMTAAAASVAAPKTDPMEEMLAAKLMSPEGLQGGISKVFSNISIVKKKILAPAFSRDGTPASRDSRAQSRSKSRSASRSRSTSTSSDETERRQRSSTSTSSESDEEEEGVRKRLKRRPNKRNIESSQEESQGGSTSESSDSEYEREKENLRRQESMADDMDVDVMGMSGDEAEVIKEDLEEIKEEEPESATSPLDVGQAISAAAAAATDDQVLKKEEEVEEEGGPPSSSAAAAAVAAAAAAHPPAAAAATSWLPTAPTTTAAARMAAQRELLQHHESMRPDHQGYHPVRYDHPYVIQLGVPAGFQPATVAQQRPPTGKYQVRPAVNAAAAAVRTGKVPTHPALAAAAPAAVAVQPKPPIKTKAEVQRKSEGEKVPNELKGLFPAPESRKSTKPVGEKKERRRVVYTQRTEEEERRIRDSFMAGMDGEDEHYLKATLDEMQKDGARPFGVQKEIEFESRIRAFTPLELTTPAKLGKLDLYFDDPDLAGIVPHPAGCARAQGFYRLTFKQKIRIMRRPEAYQDRTEVNERDEVVTRHQVQAQKEQRSMNRRLQTMMDSNPNSEYFKVNQLKYRKKMIKFARSRIHGWGLYALEPIAPDDMIVEYIGQKIRPAVADEREKQYERRGIGSSYLFRIDEDEVIDATRQGNFARFINHSCQPNCYAKVVTVDGDKRIVIYSKSLIQKGDEITYDYKFPIEEDKIDCLCGAPLCRGTLN